MHKAVSTSQPASRPARLVGLAAATVCASVALANQPKAGRVAVVTGRQETYQRAAQALHQALLDAGIDSHLFDPLPDGGDDASRQQLAQRLVESAPAVIAAAGGPATALALETLPGTPVVSFMVPNMLDAPFATSGASGQTKVAGVAADVAPARQLEWIKLTRPKCKTVGVLHSPRTKRTVGALVAVARGTGITFVPINADKQGFAAAIDSLNSLGCDGVLMIPDAAVYDGNNVKGLLLWGLRGKHAVWAFSASVVKAGALAGQYVEAENVGLEAAALVQEVLGGTDVGTIGVRYPQQITRAVNERTAGLIGVVLPPEALTAETQLYGDQQ